MLAPGVALTRFLLQDDARLLTVLQALRECARSEPWPQLRNVLGTETERSIQLELILMARAFALAPEAQIGQLAGVLHHARNITTLGQDARADAIAILDNAVVITERALAEHTAKLLLENE